MKNKWIVCTLFIHYGTNLLNILKMSGNAESLQNNNKNFKKKFEKKYQNDNTKKKSD